jgi:hypothetical protein
MARTLVVAVVAVVVAVAVAFARADDHNDPVVMRTTTVPTVGGRTQVWGANFFEHTRNELAVWIGGVQCTDVIVNSDMALACRVPAGTGVHDVLVSWLNSTGGDEMASFPNAFSYDGACVDEVDADLSVSPNPTLTIHGRNFGMDASLIGIMFANDRAGPYECGNVTINAEGNELTCERWDLADDMYNNNQWWVEVTVDSVEQKHTSRARRASHFTLGMCYDLAGVEQDRVNSALLLRAVEKSRTRLANLASKLADIRALLPSYDDNTCCGSSYHYPVPDLAMLTFAQETIRFQGCFDDRCEDAEEFLALAADATFPSLR